MQSAINILVEHGIKPSTYRVQVLHYLQSVMTHPTVDEIYKELHKKNPKLSRTTIYNIVELLAKQNIITGLDFKEGYLRYDGTHKMHSHFKCKSCGKIYDIFDMPQNVKKMLPEGFDLQDISVSMFGICPKCK